MEVISFANSLICISHVATCSVSGHNIYWSVSHPKDLNYFPNLKKKIHNECMHDLQQVCIKHVPMGKLRWLHKSKYYIMVITQLHKLHYIPCMHSFALGRLSACGSLN